MADLLARLEASLRASAAQSRERVRLSGFELFFSPSASYLLNLAVPTEAPADWAAAIREMGRAFQTRGRRPRLEYMHELRPELAEALERQGFKLDMRAPVMVLSAGELAPAAPAPPAQYRRLSAEDEGANEAFLRRQHLAFGGGETGALTFLPSFRTGLASGGLMAAGLLEGGEFVAGASLQLGGEAAELAGVWTSPAARRRGLAHAICQRLLTEYFALGHQLCWLSAAEGAEGLYQRLGFRRVGTQLNYGLPAEHPERLE